jgi:alginate O-acetyltransferase complex protein AlgI
MTGFAMKVVIADTLSPLVDAAYGLAAPSAADAWIAALAYTLQLFFDFAGYSAMAIGLALMMGFHFPENFAAPYLAGSIQEFWQRWHMTLSRFLRDYLYVPLGGNRRGAARTYLNLMVTMVIGGFWHGANWTFLAWGFWHGAALALHRLWRGMGGGALPYALGLPITFLCVMLGWVVFRAHDLDEALRLYTAMAGPHGWGLSDALAWQILPEQGWAMAGALLLCALSGFGSWLPWQRDPQAIRGIWRLGWQMAPSLAFLLAVVLLYSRAAVPFLYFQF